MGVYGYCLCGYDNYKDCQQHECWKYEMRKESIMKSENYIVINGKKAELTEEQLKALGLEKEIESPFSRVSEDSYYYFMTNGGEVVYEKELYSSFDENRYKVANYCTDMEMMQQRVLHETLNRLLWRYSMEHKGNEIDWETYADKCDIVYDHDEKKLKVYNAMYYQHTGVVYFHSHEIAENAIKEIIEPFMAEHPDFKL